ncbi:MAG TPA: hypoxanthine phosphoribosyltransferase [Candidatus Avilachnospira avistercoris]|nr:hypoxanthine phosphoribosyltransferase [Candidatus Avilachnospira avistercoris]
MSYKIETLISKEELRAGIQRVADEINRDYEGKSIHLICIIKGGVFFMTELSKYLKMDVTMDFMAVSSYGSDTVSSGIVKIIKDLDEPIEGRDVLIVEDIIDTGNTMEYLMELLRDRKPASLKLCAMLDKPSRRLKDIKADYLAFPIEDKFVVGFGLDYDQKYRNLDYIGAIVFDE